MTITDSLRRFTIERVGVPAAKVETIHYGLDDLPAPWGVNPPDDVPAGARVLLAVARLTPQKGIDVAVRALAALPGRHGARRARRGAGARSRSSRSRASSASGAASSCRAACPTWPPGSRARVGARAPGALGGVRARRARGDARRPAGRRVERQLAAGARRRRRDRASSCRPTTRPRSRSGVARALEQPQLGAAGRLPRTQHVLGRAHGRPHGRSLRPPLRRVSPGSAPRRRSPPLPPRGPAGLRCTASASPREAAAPACARRTAL